VRRFTLLVTASALIAAVLIVPAVGVAPAGAQDDLEVTTTTGQVREFGHIIPRPNSGVAPKSATDRGGWGQFAVLGGIVLALGIIGGLMALESRRKRANRTSAPQP
jgi:hypothetical protein